ncbi:hypothetical protein HID58_022633, partial [Brassica napus]
DMRMEFPSRSNQWLCNDTTTCGETWRSNHQFSDRRRAAATTSDVFMSEILKLLCSFGGRILQTPGDGKLRYIGGETHIISIRKHVGLNELKHKTNALCNHLCIRSSISYRQKILMCLYLFDRMRIFFI